MKALKRGSRGRGRPKPKPRSGGEQGQGGQRPIDKGPVYVYRNPSDSGSFYAELGGASHLRGYGRTPDEAYQKCLDALEDSGLAHLAEGRTDRT